MKKYMILISTLFSFFLIPNLVSADIYSGPSSDFFVGALGLTLIIESMVTLAFLFITKISPKVLTSVIIANLISLPIVWFVFPPTSNDLLVIFLAELFAVVFEGYFIHFFNKKTISLKKSFALSILMNLASFFIGEFIFSVFIL